MAKKQREKLSVKIVSVGIHYKERYTLTCESPPSSDCC